MRELDRGFSLFSGGVYRRKKRVKKRQNEIKKEKEKDKKAEKITFFGSIFYIF